MSVCILAPTCGKAEELQHRRGRRSQYAASAAMPLPYGLIKNFTYALSCIDALVFDFETAMPIIHFFKYAAGRSITDSMIDRVVQRLTTTHTARIHTIHMSEISNTLDGMRVDLDNACLQAICGLPMYVNPIDMHGACIAFKALILLTGLEPILRVIRFRIGKTYEVVYNTDSHCISARMR